MDGDPIERRVSITEATDEQIHRELMEFCIGGVAVDSEMPEGWSDLPDDPDDFLGGEFAVLPRPPEPPNLGAVALRPSAELVLA